MARKLELELDINTSDVDKTIKSIEDLRKEAETLKKEFESVAIGTDKWKQLGNQIKATESKLKDFDLQFEALDKEQRATALVDTFMGLAGAVQAVSGAFIAFGAEAGAIEEAEKKILGVIAVVGGLRDVSNGIVAANKLLGPSFSALGTTITTAFTSGSKAAQAFKISLASLGIGLLIIALDQLITNWDKVTAALGFAKDEMKKYNDAMIEAEASIQGQIYDLNFYNEIVQDTTRSEAERTAALDALNKAGVQTEDINLANAESLDELNTRVAKNIELVVAQTKAEAARQLLGDALKKQLEVENSSLEDNISFWEKAGNQILYGTSVLGQWGVQAANATTAAKNQAKAQSEANAEVARATKVYEETLNKLIPLEAASAETKKKVRTELERRAKADKNAAQALADYDKKLQEVEKLEQEIAANKAIRLAEGFDKERIAIEQQYASKLELLKSAGKQESEAYKELLAQQNAEIAAAKKIYDDEAETKRKEKVKTDREKELSDFDATAEAKLAKIKDFAVLRFNAEMSEGEKAEELRKIQQEIEIAETENYYDRLITIAKQNNQDTEELEKAKAASIAQIKQTAIDEDVEKQKAYRQQLVDLATDSALSLISTLKDLNTIYDKDSEAAAKKSFERQKKLNIVETLISTYSAAQKAYASQFVPVPDPSSPVRGSIAAALAVASGLAKVAVISKQKFNAPSSTGGGGGGGGSTGGGGTSAPGGLLTSPQFGTPQGGLFGGQVTPGTTPNPIGLGGATTEKPGQVLKAYVVAGDVTSAQEAEAKINQRRKL